MDGILPVLEALSSGKSQALFTSAMDSQKLAIAALICEPPSLPISFPLNRAGDLIKNYDGTHRGKGFRAACVRFAEKNYPLIVADIISKEIGAPGLSYGPTVLVKNGISEISTALARAKFDPDEQSIEHRFLRNLFRGRDLEVGGAFAQLADLILKEMFSAHLNDGRFHKSKQFFEAIESLSETTPENINRSVEAFKSSVSKELSNASSDNVELLIALLLSRNEPGLDKYRLAVIKAMDDTLDISDYLKATFIVIGKLKGVGKFMESISEIYIEAGYDVLTGGIKDASDYNALSEIPNIDMSKISPKDIPRQARGAALEHGLGL